MFYLMIIGAIVTAFMGLFPVAILLAILAVVFKPNPELRVDGKAKTGGLLGGVWDSVAAPSKLCDHCRVSIPAQATRCPQCAGELE